MKRKFFLFVLFVCVALMSVAYHLTARDQALTRDQVLAQKVVSATSQKFKTWKTINLRVYNSVDDIKVAIGASGAHVSLWAEEEVLKNKEFKLTQQEEELDLVLVSNADLGRPDGCELQETIRLAAEQGLEKCPPDTSLHLLMAYHDQPKYEWLIVVSEPLTLPRYGPILLNTIEQDDGGRYLHVFYALLPNLQNPGCRFVFRRRK